MTPPSARAKLDGSAAPYEKELKDWMSQFPHHLNKFLFSQAGVGPAPLTQRELRQSAAKISQAGQGRFFGISHGLRYGGVWHQDIAGSLAFAAGGFSRRKLFLPGEQKEQRSLASGPQLSVVHVVPQQGAWELLQNRPGSSPQRFKGIFPHSDLGRQETWELLDAGMFEDSWKYRYTQNTAFL